MSLLANCPGGTLLEPAIPKVENDENTYASLTAHLYDSLTAPQREVWDSPERFKMLCSGRRFGKTYLCLARLICWAAEKPGSLC